MKKIISIILFIFTCLLIFNVNSINAEMIEIDDFTYAEDITISMMDFGNKFGVLLSEDNRIFTWGNNEFGQLGDATLVSKGTPTDITSSLGLNPGELILQISAGEEHVLIRTSENRIFGWGKNEAGEIGDNTRVQSNIPIDVTANFAFEVGENITEIEAGDAVSYVLTDNGTIYAWGLNFGGQLGTNDTLSDFDVTDQTATYTLDAGDYLVDIEAKGWHVLALSNDGYLYSWGDNDHGQVGVGTTTDVLVATKITSITLEATEEFSFISPGPNHSVVATNLGKLYTFGYNNYNQLGDGTIIERTTPTSIESSLSLNPGEYVSAGASYYHNIVITNQNRVFGWGYNNVAQVLQGLGGQVNTPYELTSYFDTSTDSLKYVAAGMLNSFVLTNNNYLYSWGDNDDGQLLIGVADGTFDRGIPTSLPLYFNQFEIEDFLYNDITQLSANYNHTLAITAQNRVYAWGINITGALGDNTLLNKPKPFEITEQFSFEAGEYLIDIDTGQSHSIALTNLGRVFTWGSNTQGQLGEVSITESLIPYDITANIPLEAGDQVINIIANGNYNYLLTDYGHIISFGQSNSGQLGYGDTISVFMPNDVTSYFNLNVDEIITDMALSPNHVLALTNQFRVLAVGDNGYGQLGNNTIIDALTPIDISSFIPNNELYNVIDIEVGNGYSGLIDSNHQIYMWGLNGNGSIGDGTSTEYHIPTETTNQFSFNPGEYLIDLAIGYSHSIALTSEGRTFAWGLNIDGQLGDSYKVTRFYPTETTSQMTLDGSGIDELVLSYHSSFILTNDNNVYAFGENDESKLGLNHVNEVLTPQKVTKSATDIDDFVYLDTLEFHSTTSYIYLYLYPRYQIYELISSITIDATVVDITNIFEENGKIVIKYPNTYLNGDTPSFTFDSVLLYDLNTLLPSTTLTTTTTIIEDTEGPTATISGDYIIEVYSDPIDFNTYIYDLTDNIDLPEEITINITESVLYDTLGVYPVSIDLIDTSGNLTNYSFDITIADLTEPTIVYTGDTQFQINEATPDLSYTVIDNYDLDPYVEYSDNIDFTTLGSYQITITAVDSNGNVASLIIDVDVIDTQAPLVTLNSDIYIEVGSSSYDYFTNLILHPDNSLLTSTYEIISNTTDLSLIGEYSITVRATDFYGNYEDYIFPVYVIDTTAPQFTMSFSTYYYEIGDDLNQVDIDLLANILTLSDNSGEIVSVFIDDSVVNYTIPGSYYVTYYFEDSSLNKTSFDLILTVEDTSPPTVDYIDYYEIYLYDDIPTELDLIISTDDNSPYPVTIYEIANNVDNTKAGLYTITYNIVDYYGNSITIDIDVLVIDNIIPYFELPPYIVVEINTHDINYLDYITNLTDNDIDSLIFNIDSFVNISYLGYYEVYITVYDNASNEFTQMMYVEVIDTTPPEAILNDTELYVEAGYDYPDYFANIVYYEDNSWGNVNIYINDATVDYNTPGDYIAYYIFEDESINMSEYYITIHVIDTMPPMFDYIDYLLLTIGDPIPEYNEFITIYGDGSGSLVTVEELSNNLDTYLAGLYEIIYRISDEYGNYIDVSIAIQVEDLQAPTFDLIEELTLEINSEDVDFTTYITNLLDDSTGLITYYETDEVDYTNVGDYIVLVTAIDLSGNTTIKEIKVHIKDTIAPSFDQIDDQSLETTDSMINWEELVLNLTDNSNQEITLDIYDEVIYGIPGSYQVVIIASDLSGNYYLQIINVEIIDDTPPTLILNGEDLVYVEFGESYTDLGAYCDGVDDDCDLVVDDRVDTTKLGTYMIIYRASDSYGNETYLMRTVIVRDTIAPELSLRPNVDTITVGDIYTDSGINVLDESLIIIEKLSDLDTSTPGTYTITYTVTDDGYNVSTIMRVITVVEKELDYKFIISSGISTVKINSSYILPTCKLQIDDTNIACSINADDIDTLVSGIYEVIYSATYQDNTYTYKTYVFVYEDTNELTLYFDPKEWEVFK